MFISLDKEISLRLGAMVEAHRNSNCLPANRMFMAAYRRLSLYSSMDRHEESQFNLTTTSSRYCFVTTLANSHTHYSVSSVLSFTAFYPNALKQHEHSYRFHIDLKLSHHHITSAGARHVGQPGSCDDFSIIHVRGANGSAVSCISFYSGSACSVWDFKIIRGIFDRPRG
jgi:hypothetical protein